VGGEQSGPFAIEKLQQMISAGELAREATIWTEGMAEWQQAASVEAISGLFPPLPPA
jgi:hypothetical protein